jgi:guanine deaminase
MLRTMDEAYKILQLQSQNLDPLTSFFMMTRGNAEALSLSHEIGSLDDGAKADICVMNSRATPGMELRMETVTSLSEELFVLQTMGDDRSISEVYVAGKASKPD